MKLSFVIPVCNEEDTIRRLYDEINQYTEGYEKQFVFIDDGSTDSSFAKMQELAKEDQRVTVIRFRRNFGKSAALKQGFHYATGEIVFTLDADLQDNPAEIGKFLEKLDEGFDLVSGWKKKRHDPLEKKILSRFFNNVTSWVFGLRLHDYNCGFKAYRREITEEIDVYGELHRYIPVLADSKGFRVTEIPVDHRPREFGKTKYGFERYMRGFLDLLTVRLITGYNRSPLYLFGGWGTVMMAIGFVIEAYLTVLKLGFGHPLSNRPLLLLGLLMIMIGMQFLSIGLIGELLVNLFRKRSGASDVSISTVLNATGEEADG